MQTLEFFESELLSSTNVSSKSRHLRGYLDTNFCTRVRKICTADDADSRCGTFLEACRNDRYPHHRLIRRLSRNMTCPTSAIQSEDTTMGDTKTGFPSPSYRFFFIFFFFQHVICIAFCLQLQRGSSFVYRLFPLLFGENVGRVFLETTIYAHL